MPCFLSVRDNITFGEGAQGRESSWQPRVDKVAQMPQLRRCSTANRRSSPAASASGWRWPGRLCNPRLFLMEPLSNLDARLRSEVRDSIMALSS